MNEEQVLIARLQDLAKRAYRQNIYTYTGFLTPAELAVVYEKQADFSFVGMTCFGGTLECERQMVQFGSELLHNICSNILLAENICPLSILYQNVSVRGYGKFRYCGAGSETRKGRVNIYLKKYI